MKEQLITFETAKLAKEKGFDESCIGLYWSDGKYDYEEDYLFHKRKDTYPALNQSLLQRWLREKHKEHIKITFYPLQKYYGSSLTMRSMGWTEFNTYEQALEKALQEALKLVENE